MFAIIVFTSCKKYEDGPLISLRSKTNRFTGMWSVNEIYYNNQKSNNTFNYTYIFRRDGTCEFSSVNPVIGIVNNRAGAWVFSNNKTDVDIFWTSGGTNEHINYKILRLKYSELWLFSNQYNDMQEMHLLRK